MSLYKFIDENTIKKYNGGFVVLKNRIYTNPKADIVAAAGYKALAEVELPEIDAETQYIVTTYQDGEVITPVYTVVEFQEIPQM